VSFRHGTNKNSQTYTDLNPNISQAQSPLLLQAMQDNLSCNALGNALDLQERTVCTLPVCQDV